MPSIMSDFFKGKKSNVEKHRTEPVTGLAIGQNQVLESPYVAGRREWNERYGSEIARAHTWKIVALSSICLSAVLAVCLVKIANESKVQPFIVEVDKLGEAVAVRPAEAVKFPEERIIRFQLANYITNARSVTPDPIVQKRWLDSIYAISSSNTAQYLNDYYRKNDPFQRGRTNLVGVEIATALPLSPTTWQVNWSETSRGLNGQVEGTTRWQAVVSIGTFTPSTPQQIIANPTGIVIDNITWTQQL